MKRVKVIKTPSKYICQLCKSSYRGDFTYIVVDTESKRKQLICYRCAELFAYLYRLPQPPFSEQGCCRL